MSACGSSSRRGAASLARFLCLGTLGAILGLAKLVVIVPQLLVGYVLARIVGMDGLYLAIVSMGLAGYVVMKVGQHGGRH